MKLHWYLGIAIALLAAQSAQGRPLLMQRGSMAVGLIGGVELPLGQQDAAWGPAFGAFGRYGLGRHLALQPTFHWSLPTDSEAIAGSAVDAPQFRSAMLELLLRSRAFGLALSARAGLGACDLSLPGAFDRGPQLAWRVGTAIEFPLGPLSWVVGPNLLVVDNEGGTRKNLELRVATLYHFR